MHFYPPRNEASNNEADCFPAVTSYRLISDSAESRPLLSNYFFTK